MGADRIVIVGSGFAGSILARLLVSAGKTVTLVERGAHPRFAIGESSTPLAAICLERLAADYGLGDLAALAAYGRWASQLPDLRHGLKRGFTFYGHRRGEPYSNDETNSNRLLVAASPSEEVADSHWMRSDVDAYLVQRAAEEGVEVIDRCELDRCDPRPGGWRLEGTQGGTSIALDASFVVDATGAGGFLPSRLELEPAAPQAGAPCTGVVFSHFEGVASFVEVARQGGASFPDAPYPEERAAIHHLLEEGWMYVLPFDEGLVSAGIVLDRKVPGVRRLLAGPPTAAWSTILSRYPTLAAQFADSQAVRSPRTIAHLQRRQSRAAGPGWALLPHTFCFVSPMFSTGIAWSLIAVERLAAAFVEPGGTENTSWGLRAYRLLCATEADSLCELIGPAYRLRHRFDTFSAWTQLYFAAASYAEVWQRIGPRPPRGWSGIGFLGAGDPQMRAAMSAARADLRGATANRHSVEAVDDAIVAAHIAGRNIAGLADAGRHRSYPVDLDALVDRASLLDRTRAEMIAALPRLRGPSVSRER